MRAIAPHCINLIVQRGKGKDFFCEGGGRSFLKKGLWRLAMKSVELAKSLV
jgi:hypothetical protein